MIKPFSVGMCLMAFSLGVLMGMKYGQLGVLVMMPVGLLLGWVGHQMDERMFS